MSACLHEFCRTYTRCLFADRADPDGRRSRRLTDQEEADDARGREAQEALRKDWGSR